MKKKEVMDRKEEGTMEDHLPITDAMLATAREEGREEGREEILDKLQEVLKGHEFVRGVRFSEPVELSRLERFIKENSAPDTWCYFCGGNDDE